MRGRWSGRRLCQRIRAAALALAAVLWHVAGHLLSRAGPRLTIVSAAVLAAVLIGLVAVTIADGARIARAVTAAPLRGRASGLQREVLVGGVPPAVRPRRGRAPSAPRTVGGPGGGLIFAGPCASTRA